MPPKLERKTKTLTQIIKPSPQVAAPSKGLWQPYTMGAVPSKGQRLPFISHGTLLGQRLPPTGFNTLQTGQGTLNTGHGSL